MELNGDNVLCVLYSAKKYMLPGLETKCQEFLDSRLDIGNVCSVLEQVRVDCMYVSFSYFILLFIL